MTGTNDKLRSVFLTVLMVVSVFGGTVAFAGTAAAANTDPGVASAVEDESSGDGDIRIEFNKSVRNGDGGGVLTASNFTVYVREAGTSGFTEYNGSTGLSGAVTHLPNDADVVLEGNNLWGDLSPADEVKVDVGNGTQIFGYDANAASTTTGVDFGNVTVDTAAGQLDQGSTAHDVRGDAQRVYQGQKVRFNATDLDTDILLRNVETGEILLDGSTGVGSSSIVFDTANLESGTTYRLIYDEGGANEDSQFFNVTSLRFSASLEEDGTLFEHNEDANITVSGEAIRGNSDVAITVDGPSTQYEQTEFDNRGEFEEEFTYGTSLDAGDYTVSVIDVATGAEVTAGEFSVDEYPSADSAGFAGGVFEEERGDVVEIPITLSNSEEGAQATVQIGSLSETNYVTNVTVADEDGDGEVVLEWNTYMSGTGVRDHVFTAEGDDNVTAWGGENGSFVEAVRVDEDNDGSVLDDSNVSFAGNGILDPASYDLAVVANDEDDSEAINNGNFNFTDVDEDAVGAVSINSRATESSQVWVVPAGKKGQVDFNFIDENTDNTEDDIDGNLTQSDLATTDELIVHQISASGLEGVFVNRSVGGANATSAFLSEIDTGVFNASFSEEDPGPNAQRETFDLDTSNTVVIPDYENDTYYVAVDLAGVDESVLEDGIVYNASFTFESYSSVGPQIGGEGSGTVGSTWTYEEAEATLDTNADDEVVIRNQAGQIMRGSTNVAPGTELGLRINSQSDTSPFLTTLNTVVGENRTFAATGDFSERGAGINFTVNVRRGGDRIGGPYDGRILGQASASVSFSDQSVTEENQEVIVESVTLSDGGFIAIHSGSASGDVIGVSRYLEAGSHSNVRIDLDTPIDETTTLVAMPHLDDNSNNLYDFPSADAPYTADGAPVTDDASVQVGEDTPTPTETATPEPTTEPPETDTPEPTTEPPETDTPESTPTETDEPDTAEPTTTSDGGPGFGVAVSLIALLAAALLAARRRD